jgi:hypothetical protein
MHDKKKKKKKKGPELAGSAADRATQAPVSDSAHRDGNVQQKEVGQR